MRIVTQHPVQFSDGELADPMWLTENQRYLLDSIDAAGAKRYAHSIVSLPFYTGITGLTNGDSQAVRSFLFTAPDNLVIERMFLVGALASGSATVVVYNASTGTTAPTGVANPIFTPTTTVQSLTYSQAIPMAAGATYRFQISGAAFTTSKLDLVLHIRTDRYNVAGTDTLTIPSVPDFTENTSLDATVFAAQAATVNAAATANVAITRALRCTFCQIGTSFLSTTDADLLRLNIPRITNTVGRETVYRMDVVATADTGVTFNATFTLQDQAGASTGLSAIAALSLTTEAQANDSTPAVDMSSATAGIVSTTASDYRLVVANSSGANTCRKAYAFLWTY